MKRIVTLLHCAALLICCSLYAQQDIYVNGKGPVLTIGTSLAWGSSGRGSVNNNYIFTPQQPQQNICVYVVNNNPINSHTFTLAAFQSGDPSLRVYGTGARYSAATMIGTYQPVAAVSTGSVFIHVDAAATISLNISGSSTAAGSPDTADIYAVATSSEHCGTAANSETLSSTITELQNISTTQPNNAGFFFANGATNPLINQVISSVLANSPQRNFYFDHAIISCSAACTVNVNVTGTAGSGCTGGTISALTSPVTVSLAIAQFSCTVAPGATSGSPVTVLLGASVPFSFDLRGYWAKGGGTAGVSITMGAALTGVIQVATYWYER